LYIGLERYLSLRKELGDQARVIGENLLRQVTTQGEHWVIAEGDDYALASNGASSALSGPTPA